MNLITTIGCFVDAYDLSNESDFIQKLNPISLENGNFNKNITINPINDDGTLDYTSYIKPKDDGYIVPCQKSISLTNATYTSINEIIEEFKTNFGSYLPKDYNYRSNLFYIEILIDN